VQIAYVMRVGFVSKAAEPHRFLNLPPGTVPAHQRLHFQTLVLEIVVGDAVDEAYEAMQLLLDPV